jgi:hypothetical protein
MNDPSPLSSASTGHLRSWNKGKIIGPRPPLRPGACRVLRAKLHLELRVLGLISSHCASMMWAPHGYAIDRANVRQRKTGRPVRFEVTEQTRQSIDAYLRSSGRKPGQVLFPRPAPINL